MKKRGYNLFSILAIIFTFLFFPLGIIFGIIALQQIKKTRERGKELAIASIVIQAGILLLMVAMGIIWVVVRNVIQSGWDEDDPCYNIDVSATSVSCNPVGGLQQCDIVFKRTGTNTESIGGVKLVFKDTIAGTNSITGGIYPNLITVSGNIESSTSVTKTGINTTLSSVDTVEVNVFFTDASGNHQICPNTNSFKFG